MVIICVILGWWIAGGWGVFIGLVVAGLLIGGNRG